MAANQSLLTSGLPTDYYSPDYKIEVEGREIDLETKGDILDIKVVMDKNNLTSFDLTVNNWDDKRLDFKYSNSETFDLGKRVDVRMGYVGNLLSMVRGTITSLSPRFPESGAPTLGVSGQDSMVRLKDRRPRDSEQKSFLNMTDWDIAQIVARRNHLEFHGPDMAQRDRLQTQYPVNDLVIQKNQDDARFLMERAKRIGFDCYVQNDPESGRESLYFMLPNDGSDRRPIRVYEFEWGRSLISFSSSVNTSNQVGGVTVRGWDPHTKSAIVGHAGPEDLPGAPGGGTSGPHLQTEKEDLVVDMPVTSLQEARTLALTRLIERANRFNTGNGHAIGLPDLRPNDQVSLKKLGKRFDGMYTVTKVEHTLNASGYRTSFYVERLFDGGTQ